VSAPRAAARREFGLEAGGRRTAAPHPVAIAAAAAHATPAPRRAEPQARREFGLGD
jgi:hypothetical protein